MRRERQPDPSGPAALTRNAAVYYALWDVERGTALGTYDTRDQLLDVVGALLDANGEEYAEALDVSTEDATGNVTHVASGDRLLALAGRARRSGTR
jgi:hypothetical protein